MNTVKKIGHLNLEQFKELIEIKFCQIDNDITLTEFTEKQWDMFYSLYNEGLTIPEIIKKMN